MMHMKVAAESLSLSLSMDPWHMAVCLSGALEVDPASAHAHHNT
jgi:hypothetical protein